MKLNLHLSNTLTGKKELFQPIVPGKATLYVCGVTPYADSHIGHGKSYVNFDVLVRMLQFCGLETTYIRNVTDIDDKLLNKAESETGDVMNYKTIAHSFFAAYQKQMDQLGNLSPNSEPKATESIPAIISMIQTLLDKGHAYQLGHDIYLDISTHTSYGKLSGKKTEDLIEGSRVAAIEGKKNPGDFVLWKGNGDDKFWKAPWSHGRPGWHIECSAMIADAYKGTLDIHGGGADLIFPHHENERAQSECTHDYPLANVWMHNALLSLKKEKMSKSIGNTLSLAHIFSEFDPMDLRFYFLQHTYRMPVDFSMDELVAASKALKKLKVLLQDCTPQTISADNISGAHELVTEIIESLTDDLNTPKAIGLMFKHANTIKTDKALRQTIANIASQLLGLNLEIKETAISPKIQKLIDDRLQARADKNWAKADQIRDQLKALGHEAHDKKL